MDFRGSLFRLDGFFCVPGSTLAGEEEERVCALNVRYAALGRTSEVLPQIFSRCSGEKSRRLAD